jgi:S-adenosyl-L-methionine hydrolase (adenosine-forming)
MAAPILTLTTDFGLADHYVGVMKGVILDICPRARIIDLSHEVPAYDISQGSYIIESSWRYFPRDTVHVVVIDPGVGSSRRPILIEAGGQYFVGPDNGVLAPIYACAKCKVRVISNKKYYRRPVSRTFHGRDIFAPVAAHLAAGVPPGRVGTTVKNYVRTAPQQPIQSGKRKWSGSVMRIDRFGNLITNFEAGAFPDLERFTLTAGQVKISRLARSYAECKPGELLVIAGSSGHLEISMNQGSAAQKLKIEPGAPLELLLT